MDALKLIKADHEKMKGIMEEIENTTERAIKTREKLFMKMKESLGKHEGMEENIFYPAMRDQAKKLVLEAVEEHRLVDHVVELLESTKFDDETWSAKFKVLKENILHHMREEEGLMFKKAKEKLEKDMLQQLGNQMEDYLNNREDK